MTIEQVRAAFAESYAVEREVGQGGMATVYLARDLKHNRQTGVAVEVGFGLNVGSPTSRLGGRIAYDMQRVGRTATGLDAPVLLETARVGVIVRPF